MKKNIIIIVSILIALYIIMSYTFKSDGAMADQTYNTPCQIPGTNLTCCSPCSIPPYYPSYWNDASTIQRYNNCYNYSNNKRTDTFAQPGKASSSMYKDLTCAEVSRAAQADGLVPIGSGSCSNSEAKIALVVAPGQDYHWYRLDSNGMWSHKPGSTRATDRDNSNNTISNPETANRGMYTNFCGYYCSCSDKDQGMGHENIR